jgi:tetratricopeptide (TPR) repeat protein
VLQADLAEAATSLANVRVEEAANTNLQTLAHISDESIQSIVRIALAKFSEERHNDCLALFSLLTLLIPANSEYWFRFGIMAQKCENYELASHAYAATLELDPNNIGARLFAAQCFIKRKIIDEAKAEIAAAKKLSEKDGVDQMWRDLLPTIEEMLK